MSKRLTAFYFLIFFLGYSNANPPNSPSTDYPVNYFSNPLGIPISLAGNFGELRTNHFHMGLDIRTNQRENLPVYAAAEGYVCRVVVEKNGYGRAIVISHPNGYSTLYAHLNDLYPELNEYVKSVQYKEEKWEQDFELERGLFKVSKGQFIAWSGNTGGSQGPHLHFEIRETASGNNINPLHFNFNIPDHTRPLVYGLYLYNRQQTTYETSPVRLRLKGINGKYQTVDSVVLTPFPFLSLGLSAEDKTDKSFKFGVFSVEVRVDDSLVNELKHENFSYDDSRYINACIDYKTYTTGTYIQHLSRLPGNKIPIYTSNKDGVFNIRDTLIHNVSITIKDVNSNASFVNFRIKYDTTKPTAVLTRQSGVIMVPEQENELRTEEISAAFSARAFYDTVYFKHTAEESKAPNAVSKFHRLHSFIVPVHDSFDVKIKADRLLSAELKDKVVMQLVNNRKKVAAKGQWEKDWLKAKFWDLGQVRLLIDTLPPLVNVLRFKSGSNLKTAKAITVFASDETGDIKDFRAELDGNWILFSRKDDYFVHRFDERTQPGVHELKIMVTDEAGNKTIKVFTFIK